MKLDKYNEKRDFLKTGEPKGKVVKDKKRRFCLQHHWARKEHFDLRLEYQGVMLSFAVPKGLSYNPLDKRLAIKVEDHPLSYRHFEGVIPEGEYGAGVVMLWDRGTYEDLGNFKNDLKKGVLKFKLKGKRVKGNWTLVRIDKSNWLIIKERDKYVNYCNLNKYKRSIKSNRTKIEIKKNT